ncbi:hypothetical protein MMC25_005260 [Agyrium rufum]|nr:hypothetical protein [Agyrium rufum]
MVLWSCILFSTIGIAASDFFCINLSTISNLLGMSESMAGVTFLAFGNGSPDVFSTFAAMSTHSGSLAVGELIGAAGFITAVVAGSMALVRPFKVARASFIRDVGFFIVAASFSMIFLADGYLHLWECIVMVAFYIFYVLTVVLWHWYVERRRKRRAHQALIRGDHTTPEINEWEAAACEDEPIVERQRSMSRAGLIPDLVAVDEETGPTGVNYDDDEDDEDAREHWMAELNSNMHVTRPPIGNRRVTPNPIRPSLVGALEFRAVLSSLQKSRNIQSMPLNSRRYSDDPTHTLAQQQEVHSHRSDPKIDGQFLNAHQVNKDVTSSPQVGRTRAVSANDLGAIQNTRRTYAPSTIPELDLANPMPSSSGTSGTLIDTTTEDDQTPAPPVLHLDTGVHTGRSESPSKSPTHLTPQRARTPSFKITESPDIVPQSRSSSKPRRPMGRSRRDTSRHSSLNMLSTASSPLVFPSYHDDPNFVSRPPSLRLPSSYIVDQTYEEESKPLSWWPYTFLPSPEILMSTIFPSLYGWRQKNAWGRFLGVIAAPSVFFLTITLPVVEFKRDEDDEDEDAIPSTVDPDPGILDPATLASPTAHPSGPSPIQSPPPSTTISLPSTPKDWNRWLVSLQLYLAPLFTVVMVYLNLEEPISAFPILLTILTSTVFLALLLLTTSPTQPPRFRNLLCFAGFAVSITWISTIAGEVVGLLKAFGVILGISDAILGLTIFAVGASLGDWVADITVARLGYPVMALSACFGGPMLNILLGIGVSGIYITIRDAGDRHARHPHRQFGYRPYQIEVGRSLIISGITLLVTLVMLLVAVPMNKWMMDRKIGYSLLAIWTLSTVVNVGMEVTGWGGAAS